MSRRRIMIRQIAKSHGFTFGKAIKKKFKISRNNWNGSNR